MLRPYQEDVRRKIFAEIREGKKRVAVCMPTGAGKTRLAAQLIKDANSKGKKCLFIVHLKTLVKQAATTFVGQGLNVGIIQGENTSFNESLDDVIVASIQTLARRKMPDQFSIAIIDEMHILFRKHIEIMEQLNNLIYVGLSATPLREDLGKYFQSLVNGPSVQDLVDIGALVPSVAYHPEAEKIAEVRKSLKKQASPHGGMDYQQKDMEQRFNTARVVGDIVANWKKLAENRSTIVFSITKANARHICDTFESEGIEAGYIEDKTPEAERAELFRAFEKGTIRVMCSVGVLAIGFDAPWVSCVVLARCTSSPGYHMQQVGRGLRAHPGKKDCIILDHTGNLIEHGMPEEFHVEALSSEDRTTAKAKKRKKKISACKGCAYVFDSAVRSCPKCGLDRFGRGVDLVVIDGELVKATAPDKKRTKTLQEKRTEYLGLLWYAREHGYKDGWAYVKFCERNGGQKPQWAWRSARTVVPSQELVRWIKRSQIAWAKSRKRHEEERA